MDRTVLDRFGRVLLPKPLRDQVGIQPGDSLRIAIRKGRLVLDPIRSRPGIVLRNGFPVLTGYEPAKEFDWKGVVRRGREDRIRTVRDGGTDS